MNGKIVIASILVVLMLFSGCGIIKKIGPSSSGDEENGNTNPTPTHTEPSNIESKHKNNEEDHDNIEKKESLITSNKEFSWDIFKTLNEEDVRNEVFISPFSISSMLAMALNGAEGTTKKVLVKGLRYEGISMEELSKGYAYLIDRINNLDEKVEIEIANSIWIKDGFEVKQNFIETNKNYMKAEVDTLDFSDANAAKTINNWIAEKTRNLITKMISPPIADEVVMYLINAIYFKGEWTEAFKAENTFKADFHAYDKKTDKVSMMKKSGNIEFYQTDEYQAVRLPYGNEKTGMVIILPNGDINELIKDINNDKWNTLLSQLKPVKNLQLQLPKFKMEYGIKDLNKSISALGMQEIFTDSADFSGIAQNLFISKALHKAVIDVNEEGTEAAAVTVGEVSTTSFSEPVTFIANRPFIFLIIDNEEGNILFMGKKLYGDR